MNKMKITLLSLAALVGIGLVPMTVGDVAMAAPAAKEILSGANATGQKGGSGTDLQSRLQTIVNILLFILGAIAVIMIVIGGIRYTTSNGDASATKGAKDTILYSVVGLVVAILAYAIVSFVINAFM